MVHWYQYLGVKAPSLYKHVDGLPDLPLADLRAAWTATLPALFGSPEATVGAVPAGTVPTS